MKGYEITRLCDISWTDFADPMNGVFCAFYQTSDSDDERYVGRVISDEEVISPTASLEIASPILSVIGLNEKEMCVMSKENE